MGETRPDFSKALEKGNMCMIKKHLTDSLFGAPCQDNLHQVSTNHCKSGGCKTSESVCSVVVVGRDSDIC